MVSLVLDFLDFFFVCVFFANFCEFLDFLELGYGVFSFGFFFLNFGFFLMFF